MYGVHNALGDLARLGELCFRPRIDYDGCFGIEGGGPDNIAGGVSTSQSNDFFEILGGKLPQLYGASRGEGARCSARSRSAGGSVRRRTGWKFD